MNFKAIVLMTLKKTGNGTGNFLQVDGWKKSVPSDGSSEIDINPEVQSHFADVIARTAFGRSYREGKKIIELRGSERTSCTD